MKPASQRSHEYRMLKRQLKVADNKDIQILDAIERDAKRLPDDFERARMLHKVQFVRTVGEKGRVRAFINELRHKI